MAGELFLGGHLRTLSGDALRGTFLHVSRNNALSAANALAQRMELTIYAYESGLLSRVILPLVTASLSLGLEVTEFSAKSLLEPVVLSEMIPIGQKGIDDLVAAFRLAQGTKTKGNILRNRA